MHTPSEERICLVLENLRPQERAQAEQEGAQAKEYNDKVQTHNQGGVGGRTRQIDRYKAGQIDGQLDGQFDRQILRLIDTQIGRLIVRQLN